MNAATASYLNGFSGEDVEVVAAFNLYAPMNRPVEEAAPVGYTMVSTEYSELTPYGVISYANPLSALDLYKYEFRNLDKVYSVGDKVEYVLKGKVYQGEITSFYSGCAYIDDCELLPVWRLVRI